MKRVWLWMWILGLFTGMAFSQSIPKTAYVVNSLGQNLSVVNLENQNVTIDALALGLYTNQIVLQGTTGYVVNSGLNEIQVIGLNPLSTLSHIDIGSGSNPWNIVFWNDSLAFVSELFTNQVALVNVQTGQVLQHISVGTGPEGMCIAGHELFVANSGFNGSGYNPGEVTVIDLNSLQVVDTLHVAVNPQDVTADSLGHLLVACTGDYVTVSGSVHIFDLNTLQPIDTVHTTTFITSIRAMGDARFVLGTFGSGVLVYNQATGSFEVDTSNPLPGGPGIAIDADQNIYVTDFNADSLRVFNSAYQRIAAYPVGDGPVSVAVYEPASTGIVKGQETIPRQFTLLGNYPNPFNPQTTIEFELAAPAKVQLDVFNVRGEKITTLVNAFLPSGTHKVVWNGRDHWGNPVASGIYYYRLTAGKAHQVRAMVLVR